MFLNTFDLRPFVNTLPTHVTTDDPSESCRFVAKLYLEVKKGQLIGADLESVVSP